MDDQGHSLPDLVDWLVSLALAGSLPPGISHVLHAALTLVGGLVTSFGANLASISGAALRLPLLLQRNVFERPGEVAYRLAAIVRSSLLLQSAKLLGYSDLLGNPFAAAQRIGGDVSSLQAALLSGEAAAIAGGVSGLALGAVGTVAATSSKITGGVGKVRVRIA